MDEKCSMGKKKLSMDNIKKKDIAARAKTAHNGVLQEKKWKMTSAESSVVFPDDPIGQEAELN